MSRRLRFWAGTVSGATSKVFTPSMTRGSTLTRSCVRNAGSAWMTAAAPSLTCALHPSAVSGITFHVAGSGAAMIFCICGLTVSGTGTLRAGRSRVPGPVWAKACVVATTIVAVVRLSAHENPVMSRDAIEQCAICFPPVYQSRSASDRALIGVDDLAPRREPYALVLFHVRDGALEIFDAQGLARYHGMQRHAHHARLLAAIGIKRVELVDHRPEILLARVTLADIQRNVVDLVAVRNPKHLSRFYLHRVGLVVVVPVATINHALRGENVERVVGLDQSGAEPSARPFAGCLLDCFQNDPDGFALGLRIEACQVRGVRGAVAHELPTALFHFLDGLGVNVADLRIQCHRRFHSRLVEDIG